MPLTTQEKLAFDMGCYGMTRADLAYLVDNALGGSSMLAMSLLSDAQHIISMGTNPDMANEEARKYMNMAKWIISNRLEENHTEQNEEPAPLKLGSLAELI
jgi:hypothetical protein